MSHRSEAERIRAWMERVHAELLRVVEPIPAAQWKQKPAQGGWSAAEIIAHLCQAEAATQAGMKRVLAAPPRRFPWWRKIVLPPILSKWRLVRFRTPLPLDPSLLDEKDRMLGRFTEMKRATLEILISHGESDLSRWRFRHPIFGNLDGYAWFRSMGYHEIRHTKQLRELREELG